MFRPSKSIFTTLFKPFYLQSRFFESHSSTIYALSTNIKNSGSAIAIVRVAGSQTLNVIDRITNGRINLYQKKPRQAVLQNLYDFESGELIDKAIILWFPGPKSYTGDDMCEFHIHGSQAVISRLLNVLSKVKGCRPAQEGEFTKRALVNGKLQLIEAEGIRDLVTARTDSQRKRALSAVTGGLDDQFNRWRNIIIKQMAHLEAYIDFSEDELINEDVICELKNSLHHFQDTIETFVRQSKKKSDLIKDGIKIAIIGEANVGKSSLINNLCEKDLSIISPISGTTRDVVETHIDFAGYSVCIADTAGIKDLHNTSIDYVEREGIQRAIQRAKECDIVILVIDSLLCLHSKNSPIPEHIQQIIHDRDENNLLLVLNKVDLLVQDEKQDLMNNSGSLLSAIKDISYLSCLSKEGFDEFSDLLRSKIENFGGNPQSEILFSNERHMAHLEEVVRQLSEVIQFIDTDLAIAASHLRQASHQLGCLTGNITTDHVLDVIFRDFCIGK